MRHLKRNKKFGRHGDHRNAMLTNLVSSLIKHKRITTTLAKAKATRPVAEKLVTLGKRAQAAVAAAAIATDDKAKAKAVAENIHCRRLAAARLRQHSRSLFAGTPKTKGKELRDEWREHEDLVHILFDSIAPVFKERAGGYTRIVRLGLRQGDASPEAILEWVETPVTTAVATPAAS
ncbi:MAG TPA: 50S ribosomal protein L17 [Candidatus Limnocylindria bacterium]|jgi:large subunit ribosomal protein L17|nr:50S ribosomal protein L17 [Candidatus Limnocylindria bacterium]